VSIFGVFQNSAGLGSVQPHLTLKASLVWAGGLTKWPPGVLSNVHYIVILWFKGSFSVIELTDYWIQREKYSIQPYTNLQKNHTKAN